MLLRLKCGARIGHPRAADALNACMHIAHAEKNEAERRGRYAEGFADDAKNSDQRARMQPILPA